MFRPYNLTSLAAWTVGSLAGNNAFYHAKAGYSGAELLSLEGFKIAAIQNQNLIRNIGRLSTTIVVLLNDGIKCLEEFKEGIKGNPEGEGWDAAVRLDRDIMSKIDVLVFDDWMQSRKEKLKNEVQTIYEALLRYGNIVPSTEIQIVQYIIDDLAKGLHRVAVGVREHFDFCAKTAPDPNDFFAALKTRLKWFQVDEATYKVIDVCNFQAAERGTIPPRLGKAPENEAAFKEIYVGRGAETLGPYHYWQILQWLKTENVAPADLVTFNGASAWITAEAFVADSKRRLRKSFGELDSNLEGEVMSSLSILNSKIEKIELAVQEDDFSKSVFEDIFIISRGRLTGFAEKYGTTIGHLEVSRNARISDSFQDLLARFQKCSEAAARRRTNSWEFVKKEMETKLSNTPRIGLKMATWEYVQYHPGAKTYGAVSE